MGTHIDGFFAHSLNRSVPEVLARLSTVFGRLSDDLALIRERGTFSKSSGELWLVDDGTSLTGEGPCGFAIDVYARVAILTSVERFGAIMYPDLGIQESLRSVFDAVAHSLGTGGTLAVAPGGFGTDKAADLAAEGASYVEVCRSLKATLGSPARSWDELASRTGEWYLSG